MKHKMKDRYTTAEKYYCSCGYIAPSIVAFMRHIEAQEKVVSHDTDREMIGDDANFLEDIGNK